MKVDPFIEAEEVAGHSVENACRLLEVSRPPTTSDETASLRPASSAMPICWRRSPPSTPSPRAPMAPRGSTKSSSIATSHAGSGR